jgi:hypothetical protein
MVKFSSFSHGNKIILLGVLLGGDFKLLSIGSQIDIRIIDDMLTILYNNINLQIICLHCN